MPAINDPTIHENFKGLHLRDNPSRIPEGFLLEATNILIGDGSLYTRGGIGSRFALTANILRAYIQNSPTWGFGPVYLSSTGDITVGAKTQAGTTGNDLAYIMVNNNVFVSTFATSSSAAAGSSGTYIFPYGAAYGFRAAAGAAANAGPTVANGAAGTKLLAGNRVWGVAFVTDSGHITAIDVDSLTVFNHNGTTKANLSVIPTGPTGTVARIIVVSKKIRKYDNNKMNYELFFLPSSGTISDNTTTVLAGLEFYDSELLSSAEYLKDLSETLGNTIGYCMYGNRLITWGNTTLGQHTLGVSLKGKPESRSISTGVIDVAKGVGSQVYACAEYKGSLVIFKDLGVFVTRDNGKDPNTWDVDQIDGGLGAGNAHAICKNINAVTGLVDDNLIVLNSRGLFLFNGQMSRIPLNYWIERYVNELAIGGASNFESWQLFADPSNKLIYLSVNKNNAGSSPDMNQILVGDYKDGLSPFDMKWTAFSFYHKGTDASTFRSFGPVPLGGFWIFDEGYRYGMIAPSAITTDAHSKDHSTQFDWAIETRHHEMSSILSSDQFADVKILMNRRPTDSGTLVNASLDWSVATPAFSMPFSSTDVEPAPKEFNVNVAGLRKTLRLTRTAITGGYIKWLKRIIVGGTAKEFTRLK